MASFGLSANASKIVLDGLVIYLNPSNMKSYKPGSTLWSDLTINGNNGTLTNGPIFNSDIGGNILFDGINDYFIGPSISNLFTANLTVEVWVKINATPSDWVRIVGTGGNSGTNRTFGLWYDVNRKLLWQRYGGADPSILPANVLNIGQWYHIVATTSGSDHALYLNSNLIGSRSAAGPWAASGEAITINFAGFHTYGSNNIGDVKLYTRGLSATEVAQNFMATKERYGI